MGVRERRERERDEMRCSILGAAREIAARDGWQAVTIRRVAEKIEYSPPTLYEYFESKEAILAEAARDAFRRLLDVLYKARDAHGDPRAQIFAMGEAYWDWVWEHPELYQVISGLGGVQFGEAGHAKPYDEGRQVSEAFGGVLRAVLPPGVPPEDIDGKICVFWSLFHGFIALIMAGRIPAERRDHARALALGAAGDLIRAWQSPAG